MDGVYVNVGEQLYGDDDWDNDSDSDICAADAAVDGGNGWDGDRDGDIDRWWD